MDYKCEYCTWTNDKGLVRCFKTARHWIFYEYYVPGYDGQEDMFCLGDRRFCDEHIDPDKYYDIGGDRVIATICPRNVDAGTKIITDYQNKGA
jgi:hypothetical protein